MLCVLQYILAWIHYYFHHYIVTIKFLSKHVFVSYFTFTIKGGIANIYETFKNIKFLFVVILFSVLFAMFSNITHLMQYTFTSFFFFSFNTLRTIFSSFTSGVLFNYSNYNLKFVQINLTYKRSSPNFIWIQANQLTSIPSEIIRKP